MEDLAGQRFFAKIGGYYSYHFAGVMNKNSVDFDNNFEQTETGIQYGFGMEAMSIFISVNFKHGLTGIMKDASSATFRSRATYFTVGYMF